ncbi:MULTISPECIES: CocE/NonD family hydrolase C-terminal non-catalytic domain-containing protein [unclassified Streptomyces]|uniref:CocE/NonD family hydrolase C-terminal non-catalytic domain-containing protein n=1 Tax=unclassified Streptomyces TaxID=2593676 RepID=UPI00352E39D8
MRHPDAKLSTEDIPAHTFDRVEKLSPGEIVDVEIDLLPVRLIFHPGEQLRLVISGRSLLGTMLPGIREYTPANSGQHIIHTGGDHGAGPIPGRGRRVRSCGDRYACRLGAAGRGPAGGPHRSP